MVAAVSGDRLGADRPKAFVAFAGEVLSASLEVLEDHRVDGVICVVPEGWEERTSLLVDHLCADKIAAAVAGGATRAESVRRARGGARRGRVRAGARCRPAAGLAGAVDRVLAASPRAHDGVGAGPAVVDTIKRVAGGAVAETLDRAALVAVQTPQGFPARRCGPRDRRGRRLASATDCASLVELAGAVVWVEGERSNIKVTTRADLRRCEDLARPADDG